MEEQKFTQPDLVSFGEYLLSKERKKLTSKILRRHVTDADLRNWESKVEV